MKKRISILVLILLVFFVSLNERAIYAASASVAFSASNKNPSVGDTIIVTLTAESSVGIKDFQTYVAYDPSVLELVDTGTHVKGSDGLVYISDVGNEADVLRQYRMKFKALSEGSSEIYVSDTVYIYDASTGKEMSVSKNTLQIDVKKAVQKVENSNKGLASLSISEGTLTPEFNSKTTEYTTKVSKDTDTLFIDAVGKLGAYEVTVTGNKNLKPGNNRAKICVTDQNGTEKIYTIDIYKPEAEENEDEEKSEDGDAKASQFEVQTKGEKTYLNSGVKLELVPVSSEELIPEGYVETSITLDGEEITAYIPKEDSASDYVLLYGRVGDTDVKFYTFDRIGETIQRYNENGSQTEVEQKDLGEQYKSQVDMLQKVIFVCGILIFLLIMMLIRMKIKANARREYLEMEWEENENE